MNKFSKVMALLLIATMLFSSVAMAKSPSDFTDFPSDWSEEAMTSAVENGLLVGNEDGTILPYSNLTRAEMATIINRTFGAVSKADISSYSDVSKNDWYYDEIAKAVQMQTFAGTGSNMMNPDAAILRQDAFLVLSRALVLSGADVSVLNKFADKDSVSEYAASGVAALVSAGYINGDNEGNLCPQDYITRAEFAQMMFNIFKKYFPNSGSYNSVPEGTIMVRGKDVTLSGIIIRGDLIVGDGVDIGSLKLERVTIEGRLVIRGGHSSTTPYSITLNSTTVKGGIIVKDVNGTVSFNNYRNDAVFKNINLITNAIWKTYPSGGSTGPGTTTEYSDVYVRHYQQDLVGGNYTLKDTVETRDKVGDNYVAEIKTYYGFSLNRTISTTSGKVTSSDLVLNLYYDRNKYTITYDVDGVKTTKELAYGANFEFPPSPTKAGYTFDGWYDGDGNKVTVADIVTANVTLTAKFTPIATGNAVVTFVPGEGGSVTPGDETKQVTVGSPIGDLPVAIREGYTFLGWYDGSDNKVTPDYIVTDDLTLTAKFVKNMTVTFDADGGTMNPPNTTRQVPQGFEIGTLPDVTKAGYTFDGWYDSNGTLITATYVVTADVTLTARFTIVPIENAVVTFDADGGIMNPPNTTRQVPKGSEIGTLPDVTKAGYTFDGWYDSNGTLITATYVVTADVTLTARFTIIPVQSSTVTFDADGGTMDPLDVTRQVVTGSVIGTLPVATRTGYTFVGWYTQKFGEGTKVSDSTVVTADVTLYAYWAKSYLTATAEINFNDIHETVTLQEVSYVSGDDASKGATRLVDAAKKLYTTNRRILIDAVTDIVYPELIKRGIIDANLDINKMFTQKVRLIEAVSQQDFEDIMHEAAQNAGVPNADVEVQSIINELINESSITVTEENLPIIEAMRDEIANMTADKALDMVPDELKNMFTPEQQLEIFENAKAQYLDIFNDVINRFNNPIMPFGGVMPFGGSSNVEYITCYIDLMINPIEALISKYDEMLPKLLSKLDEYGIDYANSADTMLLINTLTPEYFLEKSNTALTGYAMLDAETYYDKLASLLDNIDNSALFLTGEIPDRATREKFAEEAIEIVLSYLDQIKKYAKQYAGITIVEDQLISIESLIMKAIMIDPNITVDSFFEKYLKSENGLTPPLYVNGVTPKEIFSKTYKNNTISVIRWMQ